MTIYGVEQGAEYCFDLIPSICATYENKLATWEVLLTLFVTIVTVILSVRLAATTTRKTLAHDRELAKLARGQENENAARVRRQLIGDALIQAALNYGADQSDWHAQLRMLRHELPLELVQYLTAVRTAEASLRQRLLTGEWSFSRPVPLWLYNAGIDNEIRLAVAQWVASPERFATWANDGLAELGPLVDPNEDEYYMKKYSDIDRTDLYFLGPDGKELPPPQGKRPNEGDVLHG